jgi:hypothetical protein
MEIRKDLQGRRDFAWIAEKPFALSAKSANVTSRVEWAVVSQVGVVKTF